MALALAAAGQALAGGVLRVSETRLDARGGPVTVEVERDPAAGEPNVRLLLDEEQGMPVQMTRTGTRAGREVWQGTAVLPASVDDSPTVMKVVSDEGEQAVTVMPRGQMGTGTGLNVQWYFGTGFRSPNGASFMAMPYLAGDESLPHGLQGRPFSAVWDGLVLAPFSEDTTFTVESSGSVRLFLDGREVVRKRAGLPSQSGTVRLEAGRKHTFRLELEVDRGAPTLRVRWSSASQPDGLVPQRQLGVLGKSPMAATLRMGADAGRQSLAWQGGQFRPQAQAQSALGEVRAWAEVTSPEGETISVPLGQELTLDENPTTKPHVYRVAYLALDASGYVGRIDGPELVVAPKHQPKRAPAPSPTPKPSDDKTRKNRPPSFDPAEVQDWTDSFTEKDVLTGPRADLVNYAKRFVGLPYRWGRQSLTTGADCSGYVMAVFAQYGIRLPRTANLQSRVGRPVGANELQPGDRVYFKTASYAAVTHTGIYIGGGQFIHASSGAGRVVIGPLRTNYWMSRWRGARR